MLYWRHLPARVLYNDFACCTFPDHFLLSCYACVKDASWSCASTVSTRPWCRRGGKSRSHRPLQYNTDTVPEILYLHSNIAIFVRPLLATCNTTYMHLCFCKSFPKIIPINKKFGRNSKCDCDRIDKELKQKREKKKKEKKKKRKKKSKWKREN